MYTKICWPKHSENCWQYKIIQSSHLHCWSQLLEGQWQQFHEAKKAAQKAITNVRWCDIHSYPHELQLYWKDLAQGLCYPITKSLCKGNCTFSGLPISQIMSKGSSRVQFGQLWEHYCLLTITHKNSRKYITCIVIYMPIFKSNESLPHMLELFNHRRPLVWRVKFSIFIQILKITFPTGRATSQHKWTSIFKVSSQLVDNWLSIGIWKVDFEMIIKKWLWQGYMKGTIAIHISHDIVYK